MSALHEKIAESHPSLLHELSKAVPVDRYDSSDRGNVILWIVGAAIASGFIYTLLKWFGRKH